MIAVIDPLTDGRWDRFLSRHPRASVFHSRGWLEALKRAYGYEPVVLTSGDEEALSDGLAFCRVSTWAVRRMVSLPFSDHCEPLVDTPDALASMVAFLSAEMVDGHWRSLELRPRQLIPPGLAKGSSFCLHSLDLARPAEQIFRAFHASSTQRAIRRAEREGVRYEAGRSEALLASFYRLLRLTRRRHGLPPQPLAWFRDLVACLGDNLTLHLASKDGVAIAGLLTLRFKKTVVYKYGASDAAHHARGGMPFLFWRAIQHAQADGLEELDLGRSDFSQPGLIAFKDHLGATRTTLNYYSRPGRRPGAAHDGPVARLARAAVPLLPDTVLDFTGRLLYRHLG
jgi:CelD/BcsL family acetyltransferase involved in cellulose biosynthesis